MKKKKVSILLAASLAVVLAAGMTGCGTESAAVTGGDTQKAANTETVVKAEVSEQLAPEVVVEQATPEVVAEQPKAAEQPIEKTKITAEEAKAIILADIGVSKADFVELDSERDDNEYEFEVVVGEYEYDYDVNFYTGKIVDKDVDKMDAEDKAEVEVKKAAAEKSKTTDTTEPAKEATDEKISKDRAKEIALADLGISNAKLVESGYDDGKYEFEFRADGVEYSYEIHAKTGRIVDKDVDRDDWDDDRYDD